MRHHTSITIVRVYGDMLAIYIDIFLELRVDNELHKVEELEPEPNENTCALGDGSAAASAPRPFSAFSF